MSNPSREGTQYGVQNLTGLIPRQLTALDKASRYSQVIFPIEVRLTVGKQPTLAHHYEQKVRFISHILPQNWRKYSYSVNNTLPGRSTSSQIRARPRFRIIRAIHLATTRVPTSGPNRAHQILDPHLAAHHIAGAEQIHHLRGYRRCHFGFEPWHGPIDGQNSVQVRDILIMIYHVTMSAQQVLCGEETLHAHRPTGMDTRRGNAHLQLHYGSHVNQLLSRCATWPESGHMHGSRFLAN